MGVWRADPGWHVRCSDERAGDKILPTPACPMMSILSPEISWPEFIVRVCKEPDFPERTFVNTIR